MRYPWAMRIVFLLQDTGVIYGAERATLSLVRELVTKGNLSVKVLLMQETRIANTPVLSQAFQEAGAAVTSLPVDRAFSLGLVQRIRDELINASADVLHTVGYKADLHGGLASWRAGVPAVSTVHGWLFRPDLKERLYETLNVLTLKRMKGVIVLSRFYEETLRQRGIAAQRLRRIPSGLAMQDSSSRRVRQGPLTVGMLGRLSYEKNQDMLVRAFDDLRRRNVAVRAILAGTGPDETMIRESVETRGLTDQIDLAGYMDANEFFRQIDVLVMCSRIENLPYSVLEAMAAGVPVIATRVGGLSDLVEDGVNGYLIAPDDAIMLADRLDTLAQRSDLGEAMGAAGQEKLRNEFSVDVCTQAHLELYQELHSLKPPTAKN